MGRFCRTDRQAETGTGKDVTEIKRMLGDVSGRRNTQGCPVAYSWVWVQKMHTVNVLAKRMRMAR